MSKRITFLDYLDLVDPEGEGIDIDGIGADLHGLRRDDRYDEDTLRSLTAGERRALADGPAGWPSSDSGDYILKFPCSIHDLRRVLGRDADAIDEDIAKEYEDLWSEHDEAALPAESSSQATSAAPVEATQQSAKISRKVVKQRRNTLDPAIDRAVEEVGNYDNPAIFSILKNMALRGDAPFTGEVTKGKLHYTTDNDEVDYLTLPRLRDRLRSRKQAAARDNVA